MSELRERLRAAWQGRISGCQLGKPVELLSVAQGHAALTAYLAGAGALPLRDYVPSVEGTIVEQVGRGACHTGARSCFFRAFGSGATPGPV